jgi:hypothetical protein
MGAFADALLEIETRRHFEAVATAERRGWSLAARPATRAGRLSSAIIMLATEISSAASSLIGHSPQLGFSPFPLSPDIEQPLTDRERGWAVFFLGLVFVAWKHLGDEGDALDLIIRRCRSTPSERS